MGIVLCLHCFLTSIRFRLSISVTVWCLTNWRLDEDDGCIVARAHSGLCCLVFRFIFLRSRYNHHCPTRNDKAPAFIGGAFIEFSSTPTRTICRVDDMMLGIWTVVVITWQSCFQKRCHGFFDYSNVSLNFQHHFTEGVEGNVWCVKVQGSWDQNPKIKLKNSSSMFGLEIIAHARIITYTCCLYNKKPRSYGAQLVRGLSYRFCVQSLLHQYLCYFSWELFHISQYVSLDGVCLCRGVL